MTHGTVTSDAPPAPSSRAGIRRGPSLRAAVVTAALCSITAAAYAAFQVEPLPIVGIVLTAAPVIAVILWLQKDARRTGVAAVHDLGLLLWLTWPVAIPWYAFTTRGLAGWRLALGLIALCVSAYVVSALVMWTVYLF
jgi:hypothetical protein